MNVRINKKSNKKEIKIFFLIIILFLIPIGGIFSLGIFPHMRIQKDKNDLYNEISLIYINAVGTTKEWSIDIDSPSYSSPIIVDIDRDGSKDIIIGFGVGTKGGIYCIENNGSIKWIFNTYYTVKSSPAVADLDHDGLLDIVFTCGNNKTYCLNFNGTQKWVYDIGYTSYITPCISDLDADGNFEIIVGGGKTKVAGTINCLSFDGTEKWNFPTDGFSFSSATVADLNKDGNLEVLIGCTESGSFYCLDSLGILIWSKNLGTINADGFDWGIAGSPIVADIDNDLEYEIIIGNTWNTTFCFNANGDQEWNITMPNYEFYFTPVLSYMDNDAYLDILMCAIGTDIFGKLYGYVKCMNYKGEEIWCYKDVNLKLMASSPTIADLNDDGSLEIIISSFINDTYILPNTGAPVLLTYKTNALLSGTVVSPIASTAAVADLNNDGALEIVLGSHWLGNGKIWCLRTTGITSYGYTPYPCYRGSMFRSGWMDRDGDFIDDLTESWSYKTSIYNPDTDDDCLLDGEEIWYNTDPMDEDTDNDEYLDGEEIAYGNDPLDPNDFPAPDSDGDGLDDDEEEILGTNLFDDDSDNDGLKDGDEVNLYDTNPLISDTDNDDLPDGDELDIYNTNPTNNDTDFDRMPDGWEIENGLNPNIATDANGDLDNDDLKNYEEYTFGTNPNIEDTDRDSVSDYDEVFNYGTDPTDPFDHPFLWTKWMTIYTSVTGAIGGVIGFITGYRKWLKKRKKKREEKEKTECHDKQLNLKQKEPNSTEDYGNNDE